MLLTVSARSDPQDEHGAPILLIGPYQAVNRRPLTAEARVRSRVSPCGICGEQSGIGTFFPEYFGFPMSISFHRCSIIRKNEKLVIFITGLHNKPQGCGASVASAAGHFQKKNTEYILVLVSSCSQIAV
jgi:hypothetical protein